MKQYKEPPWTHPNVNSYKSWQIFVLPTPSPTFPFLNYFETNNSHGIILSVNISVCISKRALKTKKHTHAATPHLKQQQESSSVTKPAVQSVFISNSLINATLKQKLCLYQDLSMVHTMELADLPHKSLLNSRYPSLYPLSPFYLLKKLGHFFYRVFHSLAFADGVPVVYMLLLALYFL